MHLYINSNDNEGVRSNVGTETADGFNWLWKCTPKKGSKKEFDYILAKIKHVI